MAYKYESILKTFEYSKDSYQIISDFLLSGDMTNPNVMLNVTKITSIFRPSMKPKHWFELSSTTQFIKALIKVKLQNNDKKLIRTFKRWLNSEGGISALTQNNHLTDVLESLDNRNLIKLSKEISLISIKKGNLKGSKNGKSVQGTWINRDLSIEYSRWLDPEFSIWVSQKILELVNDGVAWNEIQLKTRIDYKPLTDAIEKHIRPKYPKMQDNILFGQIANYINCRVVGKKAKDIREEKGIEPYELTRDYFTEEQLQQIEKLQIFAEMLISQLDFHDFRSLEERVLKFKF